MFDSKWLGALQGQEILRQQGTEYIKNLTSAQVEKPLLDFLNHRKDESTAMFVINELGAMAQLAGGSDPAADGHLVDNGQYIVPPGRGIGTFKMESGE